MFVFPCIGKGPNLIAEQCRWEGPVCLFNSTYDSR